MSKTLQSWEELIEQRIREAQAEGKFDNLPDFGRPSAAIDEPYDELWWVRKLMRREGLGVLPPSLEICRDVENELARIQNMTSEDDVRRAARDLNEKIRQANYRSVNGPASTTCQLDVEQVVADWRAQHSNPV